MPNYSGVWELKDVLDAISAGRWVQSFNSQQLAFVMGGSSGGTYYNTIEYVNIANSGNTADFGDLNGYYETGAATSSSTRVIHAGGRYSADGSTNTETFTNRIDYFATSSFGNASDFGDLTVARKNMDGFSNGTRGVFSGGESNAEQQGTNTTDYLTISSTGNATDFGNLTLGRYNTACCESPTRGLTAGGRNNSGELNTIDYFTIASTGNATDFGDLTQAKRQMSSCSSTTRGIFSGGYTGSANISEVDYVTIASTGNAVEFADSGGTFGISDHGTSNKIRGLVVDSTTIKNITIATLGEIADFGDTYSSGEARAVTSNAHGGLA